jgi:hypothetical protein
MPPILTKEVFTAAKLSEVRDFECGRDIWAVKAAEWINADPTEQSGALPSIAKHGNQVWLYRNADGELLGFGSLGTTRRSWFPGSVGKELLSIIPQIGIATRFQGEPRGGPKDEKYSRLLLGDLIGEATAGGTRLLVLDVHELNWPAIGLYEKAGFLTIPERRVIVHDGIKHGYLSMYLVLR